jgi:hypothetical protein
MNNPPPPLPPNMLDTHSFSLKTIKRNIKINNEKTKAWQEEMEKWRKNEANLKNSLDKNENP